MANVLCSLKTMSIKMDRGLAASFETMSQATTFAYGIAIDECLAAGEYFEEVFYVRLIFFVANLHETAARADLKARLRFVAPRTYYGVRESDFTMVNKKEDALFGRPTRINFRLHLSEPDTERQREEVYRYAQREQERIAKLFAADCQIESIKFNNRGKTSTALINLVVPNAVGFGTNHPAQASRRAN